MKKQYLILLFLFLWPLLVLAQQEPASNVTKKNYWSAGIYYDQDYSLEWFRLRKLNEDRNYTMGIGLFFSSAGLNKFFLFKLHGLANKLTGHEFLNSSNQNLTITPTLMLANGSFTPDSLPATYIIKNDRPYASITYLQTILTAHTSYVQKISTFSIGLLGTHISRDLQTAIHKSMNDGDRKDPRTPRGWGNQISNGGELTFAYTWETVKLLTKKHINDGKTSVFGFEFKHNWKYSLGYYTYIDYGLNFRFGKFDPRNWTYLVNPLSQSNSITQKAEAQNGLMNDVSKSSSIAYEDKPRTCELYLFGSARPGFMLYNAMLNGQFKKSVQTLRFQDMRHLLFQFDGGLALSIPFSKKTIIKAQARISGRSPEFELPGRVPRWHYWGGLDLIVSRFL